MRAWVMLHRRLRLLFQRAQVEAEMAEEMRQHLEEAVRENVLKGQSTADARRSAFLTFGGVERMMESGRDARGGRWMMDFGADVRFALRQMRRAKLVTVAMIGILALGIAGAALAAAVVRGYLHRPLPVPDAERLAYVLGGPSRDPFANPPDLRGVDWEPVADGFEATAAWDLDGFTLVDGEAPAYVDGAWVTPGYFELLGLRTVRGRLFTPDEYAAGNRVALLSQELWRSRFGGADSIVGSAIRLHSTDRPGEEELVTVVGVLAAPAWRVNRFQSVLRPLGTNRQFSLARLPAGLTRERAAARMTASVREQVEVADPAWRMSLVSALDEHVYRVRPTLHMLLGIAALLLLLAIASVGTMLLARGDERAHELAVRRALGAGPSRLVRQVGVESGVLWALSSAIGLAAAAMLASPVAGLVERFGSVSVPAGPQAVRVDAVVIVAIVLASVLPFAVLGVVPTARALLARGAALRLTSRATASGRAAAVRRVLVVAQVALAVALLINASLLARSANGMANAELGFDAVNVLKANLLLPGTRYPDAAARSRAVDELLARVRALPEVTAAAAVHPHPFRGTVFSEIECEGCATRGESPLHATPHTVTQTYFADLGIPLLAGREFESRDDAEAPLVAVVSAALARELGGIEQAIGSRVRVRSSDAEAPWRSVIGVAGDVRKTFGDTLYPDLYLPYDQNTRAYIAIVARTTDAPMRSAPAVRRAVAASDPALALSDVEPMEELLRSRRGQQIILASFSGGAAALALALTVSALYAVIAYLTSRRRREFAVRLALGARGRSIVALVVVDGLRLVAVGVTAGVGLAAAGGVLLRSRLFGVAPVDPGSYGSALLVVALVSLAALLAPAVRAGRGSPAAVLREDG